MTLKYSLLIKHISQQLDSQNLKFMYIYWSVDVLRKISEVLYDDICLINNMCKPLGFSSGPLFD